MTFTGRVCTLSFLFSLHNTSIRSVIMTILLSDYIFGLVMIFQLFYAHSQSVMDCYTSKKLIDCTGSHVIKNVVNINQCHWLCFQRFSASGLKYINSSQTCTCIPNDSPLDLNFDPGIRSCLVSENFRDPYISFVKFGMLRIIDTFFQY